MNKFLLITPYFGKMPSTFQYWLKCCENNPDFDFLVITDSSDQYNIPKNVKFINITLKDLSIFFSKKLNMSINIKNPYKLCDYKPLYGYLFSEELKDYLYWGYCDLDLCFGKLSNFFTQKLLNAYTKISVLGHIAILRNIKSVNIAFMNCDWKKIIKTNNNMVFDEVRFKLNINNILKQAGFKVKNTIPYADISASHLYFSRSEYIKGNRCEIVDSRPMLFAIKNKRAFSYVLNSDKNKKQVEKKEIAYFHFQKRKIFVDNIELNDWLLVPNKIISFSEPDIKMLEYYAQDDLSYFIKQEIMRIKRAIKSRLPF